jgi:hypothetical protein
MTTHSVSDPQSRERLRFVPTLRLLPEFEDELKRLPGIIAASVVTGADAVPTEIHVLAEPGKPPKQVVRDVQSFAMLKLGLDIDHRIVSVVQIGADEFVNPNEVDDEGSDTPPPRAAIGSIMVRTSGPEAEALVSLAASGGLIFEGRVVGPGLATHRSTLVAQATVKALEHLLGGNAEVESSQVVRTGPREVAVTVLSVDVPRLGEQLVSGSALVRGDENEAIARSVLDALNRRLAG